MDKIYEPIGREFDHVINGLCDFLEEKDVVLKDNPELFSFFCFITENGLIHRKDFEGNLIEIPLMSRGQQVLMTTELVVKALERSSVTGARLDGVIFVIYGEFEEGTGVLVEAQDRFGGFARSMVHLRQEDGYTKVKEVINKDDDASWQDFWN